MAKIKLTKNELKVQKDALKMYRRYLPTLTLKKQQLQAEIRTIEEKAIAVREEKRTLEKDFDFGGATFKGEKAYARICTSWATPNENVEELLQAISKL